MKITALEIRQKEFQKGFRGFDKDEVEAFLLSLSQEWEKMVEENKEYKIRLDNAQKEVAKLREVEDSLFKTLKTAEITGANVVEHANKSAELMLQEARLKSEQTLDDAQRKSDRIYTGMLSEFSGLERQFRDLENLRDNLITDIRNISNDSLDKIERIDTKQKDFAEIKKIAQNLHENNTVPVITQTPLPIIEDVKITPPVIEKQIEKENNEENKTIKFNVPSSIITKRPEVKKDDSEKSFFDEIG